jgi:hypothetical protein
MGINPICLQFKPDPVSSFSLDDLEGFSRLKSCLHRWIKRQGIGKNNVTDQSVRQDGAVMYDH